MNGAARGPPCPSKILLLPKTSSTVEAKTKQNRISSANSSHSSARLHLNNHKVEKLHQGACKATGAHIRIKLLPEHFQPSDKDVLCGRGRACKMWKGNQDYRELVVSNLEAYASSTSKLHKGMILSNIVQRVRINSPEGGFVKKDSETGRWYEVGDFLAREKTSQYFRDALHEQYSSSAQAKYNRRKKRHTDGNYLETLPPTSSVFPPSAANPIGTAMHESSDVPLVDTIKTAVLEKRQIPPKKRKIERRPSEDDVASVLQKMASAKSTVVPDHVQICPLQVELRRPDESPMNATQRVVERMRTVALQIKVDLFILPELSPVGYSEDTFAKYLPNTPQNQQLYQNIDDVFAYQARRLQVFVCYGTIGWTPREDGTLKLSIRQVVLNRLGQQIASYDKMYLCGYGDCAETRFFEPGPREPVSFAIDGFRFGLLICADIRYPELSRLLVRDHKVDVLLQPAAFLRDVSFRTWKSFRETRAVENSVYFVGVNYSGNDFGETSVTPPWVDDSHKPEVLGTDEGFLVCKVQKNELEHVRQSMPFYRNLFDKFKTLP